MSRELPRRERYQTNENQVARSGLYVRKQTPPANVAQVRWMDPGTELPSCLAYERDSNRVTIVRARPFSRLLSRESRDQRLRELRNSRLTIRTSG